MTLNKLGVVLGILLVNCVLSSCFTGKVHVYNSDEEMLTQAQKDLYEHMREVREKNGVYVNPPQGQ